MILLLGAPLLQVDIPLERGVHMLLCSILLEALAVYYAGVPEPPLLSAHSLCRASVRCLLTAALVPIADRPKDT